jgi:hypothetical protein
MNLQRSLGSIVLVFALLLVACQPIQPASIEAAPSAPTVSFTAVEDGEAFSYDGPASIAGGMTRLELVNPGAQEHGLWAVRLDEGYGFEDMLGVMMSEEPMDEFPTWMTFYGGVTAAHGQSAAYTVDLAEGAYTIFSIAGFESGMPDFARGMVGMFEVTAGSGAEVSAPTADLRVDMVDFSFILDGTPTAGSNLVEVTNSGVEPHEMILLKLGEGVTLAAALEMMMMAGEEGGEEAAGDEMAEGGQPPVLPAGGTGPMSTGITAWYELEFESGDYGLVCFVSSPANEGAPHLMLGMAQQITVAAP